MNGGTGFVSYDLEGTSIGVWYHVANDPGRYTGPSGRCYPGESEIEVEYLEMPDGTVVQPIAITDEQFELIVAHIEAHGEIEYPDHDRLGRYEE